MATAIAMAMLLSSAGAPPPPWSDFPANDPFVVTAAVPAAPLATPLPVWSADMLDPALIATPAGCYDVSTAAGVDALMRGEIGPLKGFDSPRIVPLSDGRTLWLLQDAFLDYDQEPSSMAVMRYVNNALLIQDVHGCFTMVARGDRVRASSFEPGTSPPDPWVQFWWPAGASAASGQLQVLWVEMTHDPGEGRAPLDGPAIHPTGVWLGTYDPVTLERLSFTAAPTPGVFPIWGFDVVDDPAAGFSFMFGNTFLQNLALEPVPAFSPHSATVTWLARVPIGRLDLTPEYWTGAGWSRDQTAARPIAEVGWIEHIMHPQLIDGVWWSVTKPEGFLGDTVVVEVSAAPQGPWVVFGAASAAPHSQQDFELLSYSPVLTPWLDRTTGLPIVVLSQIDPLWYVRDGGDPTLYRPQAIAVQPADR